MFQRQAVGDIGADHENSRSAIRVQWNRIQPEEPGGSILFQLHVVEASARRDLSVSRDPRAYVRREPFDSTTIQRLAGDGCFLPFQNRRCRFIPLSNIAPRVQFNQQRRDRIEKNLRVPMSLAQNFISPPADGGRYQRASTEEQSGEHADKQQTLQDCLRGYELVDQGEFGPEVVCQVALQRFQLLLNSFILLRQVRQVFLPWGDHVEVSGRRVKHLGPHLQVANAARQRDDLLMASGVELYEVSGAGERRHRLRGLLIGKRECLFFVHHSRVAIGVAHSLEGVSGVLTLERCRKQRMRCNPDVFTDGDRSPLHDRQQPDHPKHPNNDGVLHGRGG